MSATPEQLRAIAARGNILVSASAGAGKTTVMIKRLADILESGESLDNVLAVTFTKKAAAQMKEKLRTELIARLNCSDPEKRENIRVQLGKINTADISTIHSFCARLIRTHFYALKVDASFEVLAGGAEENALRSRVMDELFEKLYAERDEEFFTLLDRLRKKRSDKALKELLLSSYDEVRQRPDYVALLTESYGDVYSEDGFERLCGEYADCLASNYGVLIAAIENFTLGFHPAINAAGYIKVLDEMRSTLKTLIAERTVFELPAKLSASAKPRVKPEVAEDDAAFSAFCDTVKKRYKSLNKDVESEEEERRRFFESGKIAKAFCNVLIKFDEAYAGVKREEGKLDYGDLEHFALALLKGEERDEDVSAGIKEKYKFVFVDEYQDVNPIQDEIIGAVAGGDIFCVGDLKQAIYGFRGSRSRFFAEKCRNVSGNGEYIVLPDNFRSAKSVINFVNELFSTVMKPPVCAFDYADGHAMRGGARYPEGCLGTAEICFFDGGSDGKKEAAGVYSVEDDCPGGREFTAEGLAVLQLVEEALKSEYYDPYKGRFVKVEAGDICVLTRKRANKNAQGIVRALSSKYPVAGAAEVNICERPEIVRMLDVLSYLDNGLQDIALVSALLSPLGGFSESELVKIRLYGNEFLSGGSGGQLPSFSTCAAAYAKQSDEYTASKLKRFFAEADRLRTLAGSIGAARLIDEVMRSGNFAATFNTEQKLAALRRLQREATGASGELYLGAFLAKVREGGFKILAPASLSSDCVKVMTMHASKGLEFPVVIVADIAAGFAGDERNDMPFDDDFGFAPRYYDLKGRICRGTLLRKLYKMRGAREELSNEVNLFYVACTRAKYALHVLSSGAEDFDIVKAAFAENYASLFDVNAFTPRILPVELQSGQLNVGVKRVLDESRADDKTLEKLNEISAFEYPFEVGVGLPVKSSASRLLSVIGGAENAHTLFDDEVLQDAGTGVDAGVAYHRFLELCDFGIKDGAGVAAQIERFEKAGLMANSQAELLKVDELVRILGMPAFASVAGKDLYREREFVCHLPSSDYIALQNGTGESFAVGADDGNGVIVQGAIDLLVVHREDGKITSADIIDYKYSAHSDEYLKVKYAPQLALYKSVVSKIYGVSKERVTTTVINIRACRQIEML
ncbi:MAG: UvrD-helicase domain-containing protein [Clostridia bacterium]|nr:UvrD-helicase domain-containing protein [Clostridia bacterium]